MKTICTNINCTGCSACINICHKEALSLQQDENGFYKPHLDKEKCTNCNMCKKVCPLNGLARKNYTNPKLHVFNKFSPETKLSSTAGGFQILAKHFIANGGKVAGAAWGENWCVEHIIADNLEDLKKLYKSKYVQSYMGDIFKRIKNELDNGIKILFSGVPCQIAGLYAFLSKDYDNLYTIDLLCNNAPSQKHFHKFLDETYGIDNIKEIDFRWKPQDTNECNKMLMKVATNDGNEYYSDVWAKTYYYYYYYVFVQRLLVGNHCENCAFAKFPRLGDITLGDIFGAERIDNRFVGLKSESVMVNSSKGEELFEILIKNIDEFIEIPREIIESMHPALKRKWHVHPLRDRMFDLLKKYPFYNACEYIFEDKFDIGVVGVPTNPNFGGGLTYLALKWALEDMGKTVLMISPPGGDIPWLPKRITNFKTNPYKDYEHVCYPSKNAMRELNYKCDMFLVGSDQLYSTHFGTNYEIYTTIDEFSSLDWVWDSKKKAAYSASFGQDEINCPLDMKNRMGYFLNKFDNFSVRERSAVDLCKREFDFEPEFVLDPVFICKKEYFEKFISAAAPIKGIAAYVLDNRDDKSAIINDISNKLSLNVNYLENATGIYDKAMNMEDWLKAIATSDFVVTDSFHGTCFAIIFNRPFVVISNKERGLARFKILNEFGLENRLITSYEEFKTREEELLKPMNWDEVNFKIEQLKKHSIEILKKAIEPKKKKVSDYDILNEKIQNLENLLYTIKNPPLERIKNRLFSKTRSQDGSHRIIKLFGITIKQRRKGY